MEGRPGGLQSMESEADTTEYVFTAMQCLPCHSWWKAGVFLMEMVLNKYHNETDKQLNTVFQTNSRFLGICKRSERKKNKCFFIW